jgi:hypothetical protein
MEAVSVSLWFHGRVGLTYASCHARAPTKSCKSGVYESGGTSYLSCSYGSCIPRPGGGICCGVLGVLRARIWCTLASIPPLVAIVLRLGATSSDSFGDPTYHALHNLV